MLYCGDLLFNGGTPFLVQGSVAGAIEVLEEVVKPLGATTIVPGHGAVAGPELIDDVVGYLRLFRPVPAPAETRASHRWTPHANWTWDSTRAYSIPSASSATCTGPMPNSTASRWVRVSTSPRR